MHNNQRDGMHRQAIHRGRAAYEPNSLGGGCPFQAGGAGFVSFPQPLPATESKLRGKPEKFADHYTQARLFFRSQSEVEQRHIAAAFRFELTRVQTQAIRERVVSQLANVDAELAAEVAAGLGFDVPPAQPRVLASPPQPEVEVSPALSLMARPGDGSIKTRRIAVLVADGVDSEPLRAVYQALAEVGAVPRLVGARLGATRGNGDDTLHVEVTLEAAPSVLFDAVVLPGGAEAVQAMCEQGQVMDFVKDQYRHCKPMLVLGEATSLLELTGIPTVLPSGEPDPGIVLADGGRLDTALAAFVDAVAKHRHFDRETDPPVV